ncbi:plastocyanin/azurin family copper-binding protein [Geodermatophilus sp. SYSU D01062]
MRTPAAAPLAVLLLVAACGGSGGDDAEAAATTVAGAPTLQGSVGTEDSPDAFEIALVDEDGAPVTELPAGEYNVVVTDHSDVHDFHLDGGDGAVDEKTGVLGTGETVWVLDLQPGEYRYLCDPHPSMNGTFTVT